METLKTKSVLLLGPRRSGKSSLLRNELKADKVIDLLKADQFQRLSAAPSSLRESLTPKDKLIVIDEIQRLPNLLNEVHAMIEETGCRFVLTGSSARKLKRTYTGLLAGRARRLQLHPFSYSELGKRFQLEKYLNRGGLPPIYLAESDREANLELKDYAGDYLREEILAEAIVRKIEAFSRFLPVAARMNGELLNFEMIGSDAQVPARTIREYYTVLEDTLVGQQLMPLRFKGKNSRKSSATSKFYFFDCGIVNSLLGRKHIAPRSPEFGNVFETWIFHELKTYADCNSHRRDFEILFWRSPMGSEVDFVINNEIGIEIKSTQSVSSQHTKGLNDLNDITKLKRRIVVSQDPVRRKVENIEIIPWREFVEELWSGHLT